MQILNNFKKDDGKARIGIIISVISFVGVILLIVGIVYLLDATSLLPVDDSSSYSSVSASSAGNGDIIAACEEITNMVIQTGSYYSQSNLIWNDIKAQYEKATTTKTGLCCGTYVALVLYYSGALSESQLDNTSYSYHAVAGLRGIFQEQGWTQVENGDMQAGDVLLKFVGEEHAMIYAGNSRTWDETSCVTSSSGTAPSGTTKTRTSSYLSSCEVWRMPQ